MKSQSFRDYLCNPPPDSAARRAAEFGIDLTLTHRNMFSLTMAERLRKLDARIAARKPRSHPRRLGPIPQ